MANTAQRSTSVQSVMKQTAKTEAERAEKPADPNDRPQITEDDASREGDKPLDRSKAGGSSPEEEQHHRAKTQRSD